MSLTLGMQICVLDQWFFFLGVFFWLVGFLRFFFFFYKFPRHLGFPMPFCSLLLETVTFLKPQYYGLLVLLHGQKSPIVRKLKGTARLFKFLWASYREETST